jgi:hypothetical protein
MPRQEEHDKPENLVDTPEVAEHAARTLEDAVDSNETLEGYYAMNETPPPEEVIEEVDRERKKKD